MAPVISIIGVGAMGCAVARRLVARGCKVLTNLDGRTAATRARGAGMTDVPVEHLAEAEMILSIVPPAVAASVARTVADAAKASARRPLYVDCNAVSPRTVTSIAAIIAGAGYPFVDAGIIGQPPAADGSRTVFYASGPDARELAKLNDYGLLVEVLQGPVGAASALKMSFAGMTKGVTAICTAMMLAATRAGAAQALRQELIASRPELLAWADMQVPKMFPKAYRWVGEMEEIAEFSEDPATAQMYLGIARLYQRIAADLEGPRVDERSLLDFARAPA